VSAADGRVTLSLSGALPPVLRTAADLDAVEVTAHPADLEELFLTYYRTDRPVSEVDAIPEVHRAR